MRLAFFLATILTATTPTGQPSISFDCAAFRKQPDGDWLVVRTTIIVVSNFERRTQYSFPASEGTRYPPDAKSAAPAKDDGLSGFMKEHIEGVDLVGELKKQCR